MKLFFKLWIRALPLLFGALSASGQNLTSYSSDYVLHKGATKIIIYHCGACHTPGIATTNPRALKVFNLSEENWFSRMSERQLLKSKKMLASRIDLTKAELNEFFRDWKGRARKPTKNELKTYDKFVDSIVQQKIPVPQSEP